MRFAPNLGAHELDTVEEEGSSASKHRKFAAMCKRLMTEASEGRMRLLKDEGWGAEG